ncbi:uncharacterized protein LOC125077081 [Vanessa atalanta]|uniref:uncharacterized protein LOC125077081 n=1 Tax=Vanessa atalanta TaxID=42275 RepID=UPI001FCE0801|nr:uncharacterized protein LOC125077081 [Vanessa atalanta]
MEEELSENDLEDQMYAMLHYVDETQTNVNINEKEINVDENVPRIKRYWRTNDDQNSIYKKVNTPKEPAIINNVNDTDQPKAKGEKNSPTNSTVDLSIFEQPVSVNVKKTIEILENEDANCIVELESSDEDEVIEVALPPKPTITIDSSDEDVCSVSNNSPTQISNKTTQEKPNGDREKTASPVPSVVSSVSDEFIRGDCIALNISSKHPNNQSFDFSLHASDLLDQTPSKKKKKKRNKDATSTPIPNNSPNTSTANSIDECFATPKSKAKKKRQRTKSYRASEKSIPCADVYDSSSNQSMNDNNKNQSPYIVTDKSLPNTDVYESDSNQSENIKEDTPQITLSVTRDEEDSDSRVLDNPITTTPKTAKKRINETINKVVIVDLTTPASTTIDENIVMANVTGFTEVDDYYDENIVPQKDISKCGSTKIPDILNADLDFDNLKGNNKTCKLRQFSLNTLRAEMEKFYNESWGGEEFNHREIQKNMSRDKSLWVIDPKDRNPSMSKRKITCNYCNRAGHRDDTCRMKPPICFMCGSAGHFEPRCPRKICVNCGSPNHSYFTMCRNCCNWGSIKCAECGQNGHPSSHCPDIWRRYHNTINLDSPLVENRQLKAYHQMFCSGCTRSGHLIHTCRVTLPFSGLPINSPYVAVYRPVYTQSNQNIQRNNEQNKQMHKNRNVIQDITPSCLTASNQRSSLLKRQSKSPVSHDSHQNKKRYNSISNDNIPSQVTKSPLNNNSQRKNSQSRDQPPPINKCTSEPIKNAKKGVENQMVEKAPDFIPITTENHDKRGQIIQDNEVSDTSEVITSARVNITKKIVDKLKMDEGKMWLNEILKKNNVTLENEDITFYLSVRGTVGNQEAFQSEFWEGIRCKYLTKERIMSENEVDLTQEPNIVQNDLSNNIPKNRNNVLRKLSKAFDSLKKELGDPKAMYKELVYLQNRHQQLLNQKVISPKQLSNNRDNINSMLRKLNMVLLGQAGLADGSMHMSELYSLQEKLANFRQKNIPTNLRQEIGEHFHCIFAAIPRSDYSDLLGEYYINKQKPSFKRKKYDKSFKVSPKSKKSKMFNTIPNYQKNINSGREIIFENDENESSSLNRPAVKKTKNKLVFYHRRLLHSPTNDIILKRMRSDLMKELHMNIALLSNKNQVSSKDLKKMRKVQEQAQSFLTNV